MAKEPSQPISLFNVTAFLPFCDDTNGQKVGKDRINIRISRNVNKHIVYN